MNRAFLIARKEAGELVLSRRGLAWLTTMAGVLSVFGLLLVSNTELSLLDNAQVVYDMIATVTALGALLALIVGIDTIAGERERGSLVPLLLTPTSRGEILLGKLGGVAIAWIVMFALAIPYVWAVGSTGQNLVDGVVALLLLGTPVVLGFGFLGMALGAKLASARGALIVGLIVLMLAASPLVIGASLRQSTVGRVFDAINPFSAAVNAFDAVIIDSQMIAAQWHLLAVTFIWLAVTLLAAWTSFRRTVA